MKPEGITRWQWFRFNFYFLLEHFLGIKSFEKLLGGRRKRLYAEIDAQLKNSNRGELLSFPTENGDLTTAKLKEKYLSNTKIPMVIRGGAANWESVKKWNFDFFKEHYGHRQIALNDNVGVIDKKSPQEYEILTIADYIEQIKQGTLKYLKFSRLIDEAPALKGDFDMEWLKRFHLPTSFGTQLLLFMGGKSTMTPIHCGFANTVFVQVTGRKKWIMWAPNERIFFDPHAERRAYYYTHADPYISNDSQYPLMKYAKRYEVVLNPGDVLWFPSFLWHQVENETGGVSVAYKFVHLPTNFKSSSLLTVLFFIATKPNIFIDFFFHKIKKQDYIFTRKQSEID